MTAGDDMTERTDDVDIRKLRTLIRRHALEGNLTADEVEALGTNASSEQDAWARELVGQMPEHSKPWAYEFGRSTCQNPCCNPWASQSTYSADPWAEQ